MRHIRVMSRPMSAQSSTADTITLVISILSAVATIVTAIVPLFEGGKAR